MCSSLGIKECKIELDLLFFNTKNVHDRRKNFICFFKFQRSITAEYKFSHSIRFSANRLVSTMPSGLYPMYHTIFFSLTQLSFTFSITLQCIFSYRYKHDLTNSSFVPLLFRLCRILQRVLSIQHLNLYHTKRFARSF